MNQKNEPILRFGTAGIPASTHPNNSVNGLYRSKELGATALEFGWVKGVRVSPELAENIKKASKETGIKPTAHAPYYINLNSPEEKTIAASIFRVVDALSAAHRCGIESVVVHAGFNHGKTSVDVYPKIKSAIERINKKLRPNIYKNVKLAIELMGKPSQFGSLAECIQLAKEFDNITICLDIAHLLARSRGEINSYDDFVDVLQKIKDELGDEALKNLHMHISGIEYGPAGERKHLPLEKSKLEWKQFLRAVKDMKVSGYLICESPDQEADLKKLIDEWQKL